MPQLKECVHCHYDFDLRSTAKRNAGGKINECPDCVEELGTETAVKYLGLTSGEGKMATLSIVAFESVEDREAYGKAWQAATDPYQSSPRTMSEVSGSLGSVKMRHVSHNAANPNHKGHN